MDWEDNITIYLFSIVVITTKITHQKWARVAARVDGKNEIHPTPFEYLS